MQTVLKDSDIRLLEMLNSMRERVGGYYGLIFHLSKLQEQSRSAFQIKIAVNVLYDLFKTYDGTIFASEDGDITVIFRGENKPLLEKSIFQLRYLFIDDPLAYINENVENMDFCSVFMLEFQWKEFVHACKRSIREAQEEKTTKETAKLAAPKLEPLTLSELVSFEHTLSTLDISNCLRNQTICAAIKNKSIKPIFDEVYVNMAHLRQLLDTDVALPTNRALFQHFTELLDKMVFTLLAHHSSLYTSRAISMNVNVESVLSREFLDFDAAMKAKKSPSLILEIHIADVFRDIGSFIEAKELAHRLGYRVCLDGLNNTSFIQVDRESLGFDLAKLQWNADVAGAIDSPENQRLLQSIQKCGGNRVILCRCDSKFAIEYGQALGIFLFQGRYLDKILNPASKVVN